jgi:Ca-activated chloride channel family protein
MTLEFINQNFLLLLLIVPVIYYFYNLNNKKKKKQAIKFSHLALIKNAMDNTKKFSRINVLFYLILLSIVFLIIGLANPHIPLKQVKEGVNVVLVIDNSGSMQATDYSPNRLEAAKNSAEILINSLNSNDSFSLPLVEASTNSL